MTTLGWLIPVGPFAAFAAIALGAHTSKRLSRTLALVGIALSVVLSQVVFWSLVRNPETRTGSVIHWFSQGTQSVGLGIFIDPTNAVMLAMVSFVCLMIFIYSIGYMAHDPRQSRFFAYVSLFGGAMLGAMVVDNLLAFFLFWEVMGTCSYLLIGFWWEKRSAVNASLKAFLVTKTGDLFLLLGLVLLYSQVGSLDYADVFNPATVGALARTPIFGAQSVATVAVLLLFGGTIGKSAQLPLHVWLPDAMEGPTPASALIHAATMVSAGVYLMIRAFPLLVVSEAMPIVAGVGTVTAVVAALVAVAQSDVKRVLAFSTISQLGYMVAALGMGAYEAALFHLLTHAFFKSLLFMSAGSVIHGMEHGHHHSPGHAVRDEEDKSFDPQDMWKMGGLGFRMPVTAVSFMAGSLALSGFPLVTAGFWSKDEILAHAWPGYDWIFWSLAAAALLTAFYSARQIFLVFFNKPRTRAAVHARESAVVMVVPLAILAIFAITLGWVGIPEDFPLLGRWIPGGFGPFVDRSIEYLEAAGMYPLAHVPIAAPGQHAPTAEGGAVQSHLPLLVGVAASLGGLFLGWWVYGRWPIRASEANSDPVRLALGRLELTGIHIALADQFGIDGLYQRLVVRPAVRLAEICDAFDSKVIDSLVVAYARGFGYQGPGEAPRRVAQALGEVDEKLIDGTVVAFAKGFGQHGRLGPVIAAADRSVLDRLVDGVGGISRGIARATHWLDHDLLDGAVNAITGLGRLSSGGLGLFDNGVVDGVVEATADGVGRLGKAARRVQSGQLPDYLWNAFALILMLVAVLVLFQFA